MNLISLDIGKKRTGVCFSLEGILLPQKFVETHLLENYLKKTFIEYSFDKVIVGVPLSKDGEETDNAKWIMGFIKSLPSLSSKIVLFSDERLTTKEAERLAREFVPKDKIKSVVDSLSAYIILKEFVESEKNQI